MIECTLIGITTNIIAAGAQSFHTNIPYDSVKFITTSCIMLFYIYIFSILP